MTGIYVVVMSALSIILVVGTLARDWSALWLLAGLAAIGAAIAALAGKK